MPRRPRAAWPRERLREHGITYDPADKPKSDLYRDLLPAINSRTVDLLDSDRLLNQLVGLERRTARGGRDSIDHAPGGHDDCANAVGGALLLATAKQPQLVIGCQTKLRHILRPDLRIVRKAE